MEFNPGIHDGFAPRIYPLLGHLIYTLNSWLLAGTSIDTIREDTWNSEPGYLQEKVNFSDPLVRLSNFSSGRFTLHQLTLWKQDVAKFMV